MTDAETLANSGNLWELVRLIQESIDTDGTVRVTRKEMAKIRAVADECNPAE